MASAEIDFTLNILCPEGKKVQLMFLDIETTTNEAISVYQYPPSPSQRLAYVSGSVDSKMTVYSPGTGLNIIHQDSSNEYNGRGFMAVASIIGGFATSMFCLIKPFISCQCQIATIARTRANRHKTIGTD